MTLILPIECVSRKRGRPRTLTQDQVNAAKGLRTMGYTLAMIVEHLNLKVTTAALSAIFNGRSWREK